MYIGAWVPNTSGKTAEKEFHVGPHIMVVSPHPDELQGVNRDGSNGMSILDNWLPDGPGLELCQQLRAWYPASPIVFYSGVAQEPEIQKARAAGADGYLVKPCEIELLQTTLLGLLQKKCLQAQIN